MDGAERWPEYVGHRVRLTKDRYDCRFRASSQVWREVDSQIWTPVWRIVADQVRGNVWIQVRKEAFDAR